MGVLPRNTTPAVAIDSIFATLLTAHSVSANRDVLHKKAETISGPR